MGRLRNTSLFKRWEGNNSFVTGSDRRSNNRSWSRKSNDNIIREYKKNNEKGNKTTQRVPTRGMTNRTGPPVLQDISLLSDQSNSICCTKASVDKSDTEAIRRVIEKNAFFNQLDSDDVEKFIVAFERVEVEKGSPIVKQGDMGDFYYIVGKNSSVAFEVDGSKVGEGDDGECFGELALIHSLPRPATVIAMSSPTNLFRVDRNSVKSIFRQEIKSRQNKKVHLLEAVDFLSEMSDYDRITLGRAMRLSFFKADDTIVKKGDKGDAFYIVNEGRLIVKNISVGCKNFGDVVLEPGDYFGERSLATNEPRAADVIASTSGSAFRIDRKTFEKVLGNFNRVIMKAQDRKRMEGMKIFEPAQLTKTQFEELSNLVVDRNFESGETIFSEGCSTKAALYFVREGTVKLTGRRQSDLIKPGAYFAEDLLLLDTCKNEDEIKSASTKIRAKYSALAEEKCTCGILYLSDCRTIFDTSKLISLDSRDSLESLPEESVIGEHTTQERSQVTRVQPLMRFSRSISADKWLGEISKKGLRNAVKNNVKLEDLEKHELLGTGQFGEVYLMSAFVSLEYGKQVFALKTQQIDDSRKDALAAIKREIEVLTCMDHPYIVNLVHYYESPEKVDILMGAVYGGELFDVIYTENDDGTWNCGLPECDAKFYAMVLIDTLDYIHRKQYIYRDLKPENVLIDEDGYPIICDFGFAKLVTDKTYTLCGTPNYVSPEMILDNGHCAGVDHWALGILIYEMVAGENPFYYDGMQFTELYRCICEEDFHPLPKTASDEVCELVEGLLQKDPLVRLGSRSRRGKDIMAKNWFDGLDLDDLRIKKYEAPFIPNNDMMDDLIEEICSDEPKPRAART